MSKIETTNNLIHLAAAALIGLAAFLSGGTAHAASKMVAHVDISDQRMEVLVDGRPAFEWKVSTARKGYVTPVGSYKPTRPPRLADNSGPSPPPPPFAMATEGRQHVRP